MLDCDLVAVELRGRSEDLEGQHHGLLRSIIINSLTRVGDSLRDNYRVTFVIIIDCSMSRGS